MLQNLQVQKVIRRWQKRLWVNFNPEIVVLGSVLNKLGELLLTPMRKTIRERTLLESIANSELVMSELEDHSIALGAATQVLRAALDYDVGIPPKKKRYLRG